MNAREFAEKMDLLIPPSLSEEWDNDGEQIVCGGEIKKVLVALDATDVCIAYAERIGADTIVTHHPLIFHPLGSLLSGENVGRRAMRCIRSGISVFSYHTRLDSVSGGVADSLCNAIGLENAVPFCAGGRLGELPHERDFASFAEDVSDSLRERPMCSVFRGSTRKIAAVPGAGKDFIALAHSLGADTFLTGEASHSAMIEAGEYGMNLLCMTHYATERVVLSPLSELVKSALPGGEVSAFDFERVREYGI